MNARTALAFGCQTASSACPKGSFTEATEVIGLALLQTKAKEEAIEWAKQFLRSWRR
jgi:hypothetical protein